MKVHLRIPATGRPRISKVISAEYETELWVLVGEFLPRLEIYVSGTGAVVERDRLRIVGMCEPIDDEAKAVYRPLVAVRRTG